MGGGRAIALSRLLCRSLGTQKKAESLSRPLLVGIAAFLISNMFGKAGVITPEAGRRSVQPVCHSGLNLPQRISAGRVRAEAPAQVQRSFAVTTEQENASTSGNRQLQQGPAQGKREVTTKASAQQNPVWLTASTTADNVLEA